jgi:hypothetical protein
VTAAEYWDKRTALINLLNEIDEKIFAALAYPSSARAAKLAKNLFWARSQVTQKLLDQYGIQAEDHPALDDLESG